MNRGQRAGTVHLAINLVEKLFEHIPAAQNQFNDGGINRELVLAGEVEQGFQHMGQPVDRDQIEKAGTALERVEGAEDGVQSLGIGGVVFQHKDAALNVVQMLAGFVDEFAEQFGVIGQIQCQRGLLFEGGGSGGRGRGRG